MNRKYFTCSLIITTYNTPFFLERCLKSVLNLRVLPSQVIIADDGSGEETRKVVEKYKLLLIRKTECKHIWQSDEGFRLSGIRNKAIEAATSDYIIMTDGDVILHPKFVADHLRFAKLNTFVTGTRLMLSQKLTDKILYNKNGALNMLTKGILKPYKSFRWYLLAKINEWIMQHKAKADYVLGCNMAFWKTDIVHINGYNEDFVGWGKEDNDIAVRLMNAGKQLRMLYFSAIVFHLYHKENCKNRVSRNEGLLRKTIENKLTKINNGIFKLNTIL